MSGELYQLIAIDETGKEQVIELNNDNKNNKGLLSFIDSGTTYMENEQALIDYLMKQGKLDNQNVKFAIKYKNSGVRYLPIIYNDPEFRFVSLNAEDKTKLKHYAKYLIDKLDFYLSNSDLYDNILTLNDEIFSEISNGNYLDKHFLNKLRKYYETYGVAKEDFSYKEMFKKDLADGIKSYKIIRTLYIFYKIHLNSKLNNKSVLESNNYDIPQQLKYILPEEIHKDVEIPEEIQKAHDDGGMDYVWGIADTEDVVDKGYNFR